jgi:phospholipase A-2-activating protein
MNHLDQVAQFIEKNASGINLDSGGENYVDPYTGECCLSAASI